MNERYKKLIEKHIDEIILTVDLEYLNGKIEKNTLIIIRDRLLEISNILKIKPEKIRIFENRNKYLKGLKRNEEK